MINENNKVIPISILILTYNEEKNIEKCLESVCDWIKDIIIVDSYSTDSTLSIVKKYTDKIYQHKFENYSKQRNWALKNIPIESEWILNLDADHRITDELKAELIRTFLNKIDDDLNGFLISRKTVFMNRWIKHGGHYPSYHAVLFRNGTGHCEERKYDQHFVVSENVKKLNGDIVDVVTDSLSNFIERHNLWSSAEVREQFNNTYNKQIQPKIFGNPIQRKRFLRLIYNRFPLFLRPFLYFLYRYFFRLGFLDGKEGLIFHFLQGFWFRFLIDAKIFEMKKSKDFKE